MVDAMAQFSGDEGAAALRDKLLPGELKEKGVAHGVTGRGQAAGPPHNLEQDQVSYRNKSDVGQGRGCARSTPGGRTPFQCFSSLAL